MKKYIISDGSYSLAITKEGKLEHRNGLELMGIRSIDFPPKRQFQIVAEDCDLPGEDSFTEPYKQRNDTIVKAFDTGEIVFTRRRYLREVLRHCPSCGMLITEKEIIQ